MIGHLLAKRNLRVYFIFSAKKILTKNNRQFFHPNPKVKKKTANYVHVKLSLVVAYRAAA